MVSKDVKDLRRMISREQIQRVGGIQKKAYKYALCAILFNIIMGKHLQVGQKENYQIANMIINTPRNPGIREELFHKIKSTVLKSFQVGCFRNPASEQTVDEFINFFRSLLGDVEENRITMFRASEVDKLIDIEKKFHPIGIMIKRYHWFDFDINKGLIPTYPALILFSDLIIHWNTYVEKYTFLTKEMGKVASHFDRHKYEKSEEIREASSMSGLERSLIFTGVSFVEGYLYDVFYNMNELEFEGKEKIQEQLSNEKINDKQIIEDILFKLLPELKSKINGMYKKHKAMINIRDSYVHLSQHPVGSTTKLQKVLNFTHEEIADYLNNCIKLVMKIENELLPDLKILFWWEWYQHEIDFSKLEKLSLINKKSNISQLEYFY